MKKNVVQDVVPPKKSIRNVKLQSRSGFSDTSKRTHEDEVPLNSKPLREEDTDFTRPVSIKTDAPIRITTSPTWTPPPVTPPPAPTYKYEYDEPIKPSKKGRYIAGVMFILVAAFGISAFFKSATIRVTPKQEARVLNETFRAAKDSVTNGLGFQVVTATKTIEKTVPGGEEQDISTKAQGRIVIYNGTSQNQRLVATTRFETPEKLIYRLVSAVTVPAGQMKDGKMVAGNIEVTVEADKAGEAYNVGLKDFTIPGFKGDPKYTTVYARSKTNMTGGFVGKQKVVSKEVLAQAEAEMEASIKETLSKDITTQIPENFILYKESLTYNLEPVTQVTNSSAGTATLKKTGETSAVIFDKSTLSKEILAKFTPEMTSDLVRITNLDNLKFSYSAPVPQDLSALSSINFSLEGNLDIVWIFDENKLKSDLLGLSKSDAKTVIASYAMIKEAWIETHPFWNRTIPKNDSKVTLVNTLTP